MPALDKAKWDFTLRQLNTFVCAAQTGSFARAAEQLGVTQPAISGCIAILEKRLSRRLFHRRSGNTPLLTRDGLELLEMAEALLDASEKIRTDERAEGRRKRRVRLCIGPLLRDIYLKPMLPLLYRDHPEIDIELVPIIPLDEVHSMLEKGRVDLVVYTIGRSMEALPNTRQISEVPTVMIGPPGTRERLASGEAAIEDLSFILPGTTRLSEHWIEQQLATLGIRPRQRIAYLDFPEVIPDMVAQGLGVSVLMHDHVAQALHEGQIETFGPALPTMRRVMMRSPSAGPAARIIEDYLADILSKPRGGEPAPASRHIVPAID